jgi:hypothetical protein
MAPSTTSRTMPPAVAAAKASTITPNRSRRCRVATSPPLIANANVPTKSRSVTNAEVIRRAA